jgi:hypothetical protein
MTFQTVIAVFALTVAVVAFGLWLWIDRITLPRNPQRYLRYSLMCGALLGATCFAILVALTVPEVGHVLLGISAAIGLLIGLIVSVGTASSYWITNGIRKKHQTKITGENDRV